MRTARHSALVMLVVGGVFASANASADSWLVSRHDAGRTGASSGAVSLASPSIKWRAYVGGRPTSDNVRFGLADSSLLVASVGGRFVAKDVVTQGVVWTSDLLGAGTVAAIADLDGDGNLEVVIQTATHAHVLNGATGALLWSSSEDAIALMGAVRVRDVDGDGLPDVYLDNAIGAKPGTELAAAYSFAGGAATKVWSLPTTLTPQPRNSGTDAIFDLNDDGVAEIVLAASDSVRVFRGSDGSPLATLQPSGMSGHPYIQAMALASELDGSPGLEIMMVQPNASVPEDITPSLSAYRLNAVTGDSEFLWSADAGDVDGEMVANADVTPDLDGDGLAEAVFSYRSSATSDTWVTEIRAGETGALLATFDDARFEGAADLDGNPGAELVVATGTGLAVYSLDGAMAAQPIGAPLPGARALSISDDAQRNSGGLHLRLAAVANSSGAPTLLIGTPSDTSSPQGQVSTFDDVRGLQYDGAVLVDVGAYEPLVGKVTGAMSANLATRPYDQVALGTSEGVVVVLNRFLEPTNGLTWIDGTPLGTFVGGGQISAPLVGSDGAGPFVVLTGTTLGTVVADARWASWILPPLPRWWRESLASPSILETGSESRIVGIENQAMVARATTTGLKSSDVALPAGSPWGTPVPLSINGVNSRVGIDWRVDGTQIIQIGVDLSNDDIAWQGQPIALSGFFGSSAGDLDGDGTDEWLSLSGTLLSRNSASGSATSQGSYPQLGYSLPMIAPFQGATPDLLLQSGGQGAKLVKNDYSLAWESTATEALNGMAGTRTTCGGATRFVTPAVKSAHLRAYEGATGNLLAERTFAGGQAFTDVAAAVAAGAQPGVLSHASSVADLAGTGPAVFVGSTDGYLYAIDACSLDIRWAANIGRSLGEPVIADVDADGDDEIVVSASDGFVYGLDLPLFAAPHVDCEGVTAGADLISATPGDKLTLTWGDISGAAGYEVALISPDDKPVWSPAYVPTDGTTFELDLSGALANRPYRVAVRAVDDSGAGQEGFSLPIVLEDVSAPGLDFAASGGDAANISFTASDDVALDHYALIVQRDGVSETVGDELLSGVSDSRHLAWTPPASYWGSEVKLTLEAIDSAQLSTRASVKATVLDNGVVVLDSDEGPSDLPGDEPTPEEPRGPSAGSGGCSASEHTNSSGVLAVIALGMAGLARRRRQR